jgi:hypothetical protein
VLGKRGVTAYPHVEQASLFLDGVGPMVRTSEASSARLRVAV